MVYSYPALQGFNCIFNKQMGAQGQVHAESCFESFPILHVLINVTFNL